LRCRAPARCRHCSRSRRDRHRRLHDEHLSAGAAQGLVAALQDGFRAATGAGVAGTFRAVGAMREPARARRLVAMLAGPVASAQRANAGLE
jgi:hypothetical protein